MLVPPDRRLQTRKLPDPIISLLIIMFVGGMAVASQFHSLQIRSRVDLMGSAELMIPNYKVIRHFDPT